MYVCVQVANYLHNIINLGKKAPAKGPFLNTSNEFLPAVKISVENNGPTHSIGVF